MCRPINCRICGKTTWAGCGQHVDEVMADVPRDQQCPGHTDAELSATASGSVLGRLFGPS